MKYYIFFISFLFFISCKKSEEKILPEKTSLTESVYSSVTIQPDSLYQVYSAVGGILEKNLVEEGDEVGKGTSLIQIINNTPKLNTENTRLALELAKENYSGSATILQGIEDEIIAAKLKYANDSINYKRQQNLWSQKIGSKIEYDTKKLNYELSSNNLQILQSKYNRTKNELGTAVQQAQNNYQTSLINTKDFTVKSKINGKVYALFKNQGELVSTMEPLASVGSSKDFIIEMLVDEVDIVKIKLGQKALITLDSYNSTVFESVVNKIYPRKDERTQTFKIEAIFSKPPKVLYPGLSGEGNIIISQKEKVLTIPKDYLVDENKVQTDAGLIEVVTGLESLDKIEVLEGIDSETYIYKPSE
ncbi:efflux RND transporter periplasmic adaptor subunit [Urechidicola croceus]|uniref:Efflux transporter periplasmic adaptor subunit n=1 Tax=Urechidicola croceus TaxID=1850246 RepID=A0A1D8P7Z6_9FLAO|nr:efflux RND transporter periplasmic adaptor subunit [Urechidicola croceus]AOW20693.1 efflux transporter periplasmic adaptor subunit [Urechidicola croceus]